MQKSEAAHPYKNRIKIQAVSTAYQRGLATFSRAWTLAADVLVSQISDQRPDTAS
jgi:hypothetical protein